MGELKIQKQVVLGKGESPVLFILFADFEDFGIYSIQYKAVETFALASRKFFNDLTLTLFDDDIDSIIGFLVITCSSFLLRI